MPAYLPPELWMCVAECLYDEYIDEAVRLLRDLSSTTSAALIALANLCRVSKPLKSIATPFLYRTPFTPGISLFLDTITSYPELSRHVQELSCNRWHLEGPGMKYGRYPPAFIEAIERHTTFALEHHVSNNGFPDWEEGELDNGLFVGPIADAALLSFLPNLACVFLQSSSRYVCCGLESGSLPKLTYAFVYHGDDEFFIEPCLLKYLAEAAPNITHLHLSRLGMGETDHNNFPLFPNVTFLSMQSSAVEGMSWPFLLGAFPRLEALEYGVCDIEEYNWGGTARDIQAALVSHCPSLKSLCIDFSWVDGHDMPGDVDCGFDHGLASLRELEYLITDLSCIGSPELGDGGKDDDEEYGELNWLQGEEDWIDLGLRSEALPASLRGLRIIVWDIWGWGKLVESLLDLAMKAPTQLPALEKISILRPESTRKWDDKIMDAWKDTGVEMTLETSLSTWDSKSPKDWDWP
ncbi:hypothetical protein B0T11DRAFT_300096 [Plectosphaerella cucumerina]|uniref:F-box domain-containing protein n=1 Tax=Plectosphaerella cucumerina TaxID=40658 RepID=A0A8K0TFC4_9PEZI|nr:hypothetical protein B0T11DRAFT_300096 [Plectosphaerella cucumerina]